MSRRIFLTIVIPLFIITVTVIVVALGRGYRIDVKERDIKTTGILVATSSPDGAQVFINDKFSGATNSNISLDPDWYDIKIKKQGYQDWTKKMRIQGEVIAKTGAVLFLSNPSLTPLTNIGATNPILSPDGTKIAYTATPSAQLTKKLSAASYQTSATFLLDLTSKTLPFNKNPKIYEGSLTRLLAQWKIEKKALFKNAIDKMPPEFVKVATNSSKIISFSPDERKVLYTATSSATLSKAIKPPLIGTNPTKETRDLKPNKSYVYNSREDKNYEIPKASSYLWLSTSDHLVLIEKSKISIIEYDGTNKITVYSGPFENSFVFPHPSQLKLIILTTLNPEANSNPNLYILNLR